jgi:hypothetical protein
MFSLIVFPKAQNMPANSHDGDDDDLEDEPNLDDDEPMKKWNTMMQTPDGFTRNPVLVSPNLQINFKYIN